MNNKEIGIVLGSVSAVLIFAMCMQFNTISSAATGNGQSITEDGYLIEEMLATKEEYERLSEALTEEEGKLETIRKDVAKNNENAEKTEQDLVEINKKLGLTDLTGEGIIVTLDDCKIASPETIGITEDLSLYLVHYIDVLNVINELWNAGAEAISVNGQRIVSSTAITCIGNVISINGEKVGAPFVINAIGNPEYLYGITRLGSYLSNLEEYGIMTEAKKSGNVFVPKYTGKYTSDYIKDNEI